MYTVVRMDTATGGDDIIDVEFLCARARDVRTGSRVPRHLRLGSSWLLYAVLAALTSGIVVL